MLIAFIVLLKSFNGGRLSGKRDIEHIAALARMQAHAVTCPDFCSRHYNVVDHCLVFQQLPFPLVHETSLSSGRRLRKMPCSFMSCSGGSDSVRSRIWRARSSESRISRFSSSVMVMMRKERISSISSPSNRSPALSGAICGKSYRMIGEESIVSWLPAAPTITGHIPTFWQLDATSRSSSGGSSRETNSQLLAPNTTCAEISEYMSA